MSSHQKPLPYVLYHSPCPDGMGAAYAAWRHFGDQARYVGINHGEKLPDFRERADIYMLDFSLKRPALLALATRHDIYIVDHHIGAAKELEGIEQEATNIAVKFDNDHSGAWLAWEYFHLFDPMPWLIPFVEDRDLWRNQLPDTNEIHAALSTHSMDFATWHKLMTQDTKEQLIKEGAAILRYTEGKKVELARNARLATVGGFAFPAVNAPYFFSSDLGHHLLELYPDAPFSGTYRDEKDGTRSWSLRSDDDRVDVQVLASALGGGGHRNASGMQEEFAGEKVHMANVAYDDA